MAPAPTPSAARTRIMNTVDRLFYADGIQAVGVNRVVEEADVTRVTLYRHFRSKDDLVLAYLTDRARIGEAQLSTFIAAHPDDPRGALSMIARTFADEGFGDHWRGCPFLNASAEYGDLDHPVRREAARHRGWITAQVTQQLTRLGVSNAEELSRALMMLRTGAVAGGAVDHDPDIPSTFLRYWELLIDGALESSLDQCPSDRDVRSSRATELK
jgi:AcrR family transcriptional regulator